MKDVIDSMKNWKFFSPGMHLTLLIKRFFVLCCGLTPRTMQTYLIRWFDIYNIKNSRTYFSYYNFNGPAQQTLFLYEDDSSDCTYNFMRKVWVYKESLLIIFSFFDYFFDLIQKECGCPLQMFRIELVNLVNVL